MPKAKEETPSKATVTVERLRRVLDASDAEYAIFWRAHGRGHTGTLRSEAWLSADTADGSLMEPDLGREYTVGQGDIGTVYAAKSTRIIRDVCACDIKTFARLQLACYHRIKSVALTYCKHGDISGVLELGTTKADWEEVPAQCDGGLLFNKDARGQAVKAASPVAVTREQLREVIEAVSAKGAASLARETDVTTRAAPAYAIFWRQIGRAAELKAVCWDAPDDACMRRSQTFSSDEGDPCEVAWRTQKPSLLPDASKLESAALRRVPLVLYHKIRSIAFVPVRGGVLELGTHGLWTTVPSIPDSFLKPPADPEEPAASQPEAGDADGSQARPSLEGTEGAENQRHGTPPRLNVVGHEEDEPQPADITGAPASEAEAAKATDDVHSGDGRQEQARGG